MDELNQALEGGQTPEEAPQVAQGEEVTEEQTTQEETELQADPRREWESEKRRVFGALTRKDKELREREQQLKSQQERIALADKYDHLRKIARDNPDEVFNELGLDYKYVTEYYMNNGQVPESEKQERILKEIEDLKKQREEEQQKAQQRQQAQAVTQYVQGIKSHVEENTEKYPLVASNWREAVEVSVKYADYIVKKTGQVPSNDFLMGEVEKYFDQKISPLLKNEAIRNRYGINGPNVSTGPDLKQDTKSQEVKPSSKVNKGKTLTNKHSLGATTPEPENKTYDPVESRKRAAALLKYN